MTIDLMILSYNIHHGRGMDGVVDLARLANVIKSVSPDLVALQEVDRNKPRTGRVDQAVELMRLTEMKGVYSVSIDTENDGLFGNLILSRFPIVKSKSYPLPGEPRSLLSALIQLPGDIDQQLIFYSTHLDTGQQPRRRSINNIRKIVNSFPGRNAVLAGDLNATPGSLTMKRLLEFWVDATAGQELVTINSQNGQNLKQIDYILYRPEQRWHVLETKVMDEPVASDHFPLMARLRIA